ncbi:bifunctional phosphopantothenoylcysteine decarboxylase/phosphopantothenate--cysteine ligase CoaBC [Micromonospora endophytica]|uniref:Coenzyme A biosynthesis bifunctional protein CoaBC n=1 Tax=Micromonospora endophytica TaxID=515350 RepID=A0A2W2D8X2_9ACTN|nr:bifunctional phosphopantothenoylcysteine decarboxylase/phosphopantothenate--cysteine ligase CoaBC [Micromonospora endophytica]PZG00319.1 bifunctional phosphopantothenoylcysteine decarboxylase/phosphopantothenate--cysteine ligase CoaBC [Micromonospora endophytica]RIW49879.1 bifunctional phosphopantothenoylcysteine decarboxylase/phosphopantothenate--cysteine ligase CoaBC [Micromonospora endophytica]BCJ57183.1 phosphopantothenoylcysteine decarboxylase [Micromonospora endophytica]
MSARIILGVGGGIAAYKACELLRLLTESGHAVRVVPTAAALRFVGAPTWAALSGHPVAEDVWTDVHEVPHVRLGQQADLVVVAPATADLLAKAAQGLADDLLTNTLLTARCPVLLAPAMHTEMWEHPATSANVATLRARGVRVIEPAVGRLTGADTGKGRLPDPAEIFAVARRALARGLGAPADLTGRHVVITAGGTREPLDPVRFLGNRSSGKQGYAFARSAVARGARVTLISANVTLPDPAGADLVRVGSTAELREATLTAAVGADAVVMAAAPADFRPATYSTGKIKKSDDGVAPTIDLVTNPDIAAELGQRRRPEQVLVVFAAETGDAEANGRAKLARKRADLIVINEVGPDKVFGAETNAATVIGADGSVNRMPERSKEDLADDVWDLVVARFPDGTSRPLDDGNR